MKVMRTRNRKAFTIAAGLLSAFALFSGWSPREAVGQTYPMRPIVMVVPYPAGGPTDLIARIVTERMRASLGQPIVIENIVGGSGSLGVGRVARAAPDGYTLIFGTSTTHVINGALLSLPYDLLRDFEPVGRIVDSPMILVARKALPADDLSGLVEWLKTNPNKALAGTPGPASMSHLAGILFQKLTATQFHFVPYRGVGPATHDLIAGRIDIMFDLIANASPHVSAGNIKAFAILAKSRLPTAPNIPSVVETGLPELLFSSWQAIWAPRGTSGEVVSRLNAAILEALKDASVRQRLTDIGQTIPPRDDLTPQALANLQRSEIEKWWPIIQAANLRQN
jgi:tripartite-type tricarboxylate transporter receptor subunit TctC